MLQKKNFFFIMIYISHNFENCAGFVHLSLLLHYENLQHYLRLGLTLKNIYCVLEFNQSQCLKHILNSEYRKE